MTFFESIVPSRHAMKRATRLPADHGAETALEQNRMSERPLVIFMCLSDSFNASLYATLVNWLFLYCRLGDLGAFLLKVSKRQYSWQKRISTVLVPSGCFIKINLALFLMSS